MPGIEQHPALFLYEKGMQIERRKFQRHLLRFRLEIRGKSQNGQPFVERAQLINISGGGALFHSLLIDKYFQGQIVETNIILPGTPAMKGQMYTRATVVRLIQDNREQAIISIHFMDPFKLFRDQKPPNGIHDKTSDS